VKMIDIGKTLREAREKKNLSIHDVAVQTLIREYYLKKIEANEFGEYDGFIHAYIRKYAKFLWLNPTPLSAAYKELFKSTSAEEEKVVLYTRRKRYKGAIIIVIVVLILIVIFYPYLRKVQQKSNNSSVTAPLENAQPPETKPPETKPAEQTKEPKEEIKGVDIIIYVDERCWIGVTADGKYSQLFINKGEKKEFKGEEYIKIRFGNAKHAYVTKNGQDMGIVNKNKDVVEVTYKP